MNVRLMKKLMDMNIFNQRSLKTRVTLFTLCIFLIGLWTLTFYTIRMLREDMLRSLGEQQFSTVSLLSAQVNLELDERLRALEIIAEEVSQTNLENPSALQKLLEHHPILLSLFNSGVLVCQLDGTAIAEAPLLIERIGVNYIDRDHVAVALKEGKACIGRPVFGRKLHAPIFGISVPIRDAQGKVIGALSGVTDLGKLNFLDKITENRYGKTGGYVLLIPKYRLIVTATDKSRIMESLPALGINPMLDRFLQGYEGPAVYTNPHGVEVVGSARKLPVSDWLMGVTLPTEEAFAPIRAMQQRMLLATIFMTLLIGGLSWWMLKRQLLPVIDAARTLATFSRTDQPPQPLPITSQDEIGDLIGGFNRLLGTLTQREDDLKRSEELYRLLTENIKDVVWILDTETMYFRYVSPSLKRLRGYTPEEILGEPMIKTVTLEAGEYLTNLIHCRAKDFLTGKEPPDKYYTDEVEQPCKDGSTVWTEVITSFDINAGNGRVELRGVSRDITERKQTEAYREMSREVLQILNEPGDFKDSIHRVLTVLKTRTGFDAVGIRLQDVDDFPYFAQEGFSDDLLLTENSLIERFADGSVCQDKEGNVRLECTCGLVISDKTDPNNPLFTPGGSFWTNDSFPLLDIPPEDDPRLHPRNQCIHHGYASIAIVPIRNMDRIVGLIQLNDRRKGCFTLNTVNLLEGIAPHIGAALMRKHANDEMRKSEEFAMRVIESSRDCIKVLNLEGHILSMSEAGRKLLEIDDITPYLHKSWVDFWQGKDREAALECISKARQDEVGILHGFCETAKGTPKWWEVTVSPIKDPQGNCVCLLAVSHDITERKRIDEEIWDLNNQLEKRIRERTAELEDSNQLLKEKNIEVQQIAENIKESKQQLLDIIDFYPDPTFVINNDKVVIFWNSAMEKMSGVSKAEMIGKGDHAYTIPFYGERRNNLLDLLDENDEDLDSKYQGIVKDNNTLSAEAFCPDLNGGKGSFVWATVSSLFNLKGVRVGAIESIRDITDRRHAQDALKQAYAEVEMQVRKRTAELAASNLTLLSEIAERKRMDEVLRALLLEKEMLLKEVHHRVKNNLAAIMGLLDLQGQSIDDKAAKADMAELSNRIRSMVLVHEQLYQSNDFAQIDFQHYLDTMTAHLCTSYARSKDIHFSIAAKGVNVSLEFAVPCGLLITELVTNALKYAFPESWVPETGICEITVSAEWDGNAYMMTVSDNGVGLPVDLDWTNTRTLGLLLVKMLGEHQLQGKIEVDRTGGTKFRLWFKPKTMMNDEKVNDA